MELDITKTGGIKPISKEIPPLPEAINIIEQKVVNGLIGSNIGNGKGSVALSILGSQVLENKEGSRIEQEVKSRMEKMRKQYNSAPNSDYAQKNANRM